MICRVAHNFIEEEFTKDFKTVKELCQRKGYRLNFDGWGTLEEYQRTHRDSLVFYVDVQEKIISMVNLQTPQIRVARHQAANLNECDLKTIQQYL